MTARHAVRLALVAAALLPATGCRRRPPPPPPASADSTLASYVEVDTLAVDDYSTRLLWSGFGFSDVRFSKQQGQAVLRGDSLVGLRLTLDAASLIQTGSMPSSEDPRSPAYFDAERHPEVVLTVDRVQPDSASATTQLLSGTLALWGSARPVSFPASVRITTTPIGTEVRRSLALNASFVVDAADWDSTNARRSGPLNLRLNLIARPRDAQAPGTSIRAAQRYQDSLRTLPGAPAGDSATRD